MKHIIVTPPPGAKSRMSKGFVLGDDDHDSNSLDGLKRRLEEEFQCPVAGVAVVRADGTKVEVADMDFIR